MCGHQLEHGQSSRKPTSSKIWLFSSTSSYRLLIALQLGKELHFYLPYSSWDFDWHECMQVLFMLSQLFWFHLLSYIPKALFPCSPPPTLLLTVFPQSSAMIPILGRRNCDMDIPSGLRLPHSPSLCTLTSMVVCGVSCHYHLKQINSIIK